jgi:hypothetical protein
MFCLPNNKVISAADFCTLVVLARLPKKYRPAKIKWDYPEANKIWSRMLRGSRDKVVTYIKQYAGIMPWRNKK